MPNQRFRFTDGCDQPTVDLDPKKAGNAFQAVSGQSCLTLNFLCTPTYPAHFAVSSARHASSPFGAFHRGVPIWRAGDGTRTRNIHLGRVMLYQLSYSRITLFSCSHMFLLQRDNWDIKFSNSTIYCPCCLHLHGQDAMICVFLSILLLDRILRRYCFSIHI